MSGSLIPSLPGDDQAVERGWAVRRAHFEDEITFAVPGMVGYDSAFYANRRESFVAVSVTGARCALGCEHCRGRLLEGMLSTPTPEDLTGLARVLVRRGCTGILVTGGCDEQGRVPLTGFHPAIETLKGMGLDVLVHSGLVTGEEAAALAETGVDQVLLDVIGDVETIREVCHLDRGPEDYLRSLENLRGAGVSVAPHVVVGLHFGEPRGELRAVEAIGRVGADRLVLVALKTLPGTPMAGLPGVRADEVVDVAAAARVANPRTPISFGCARPYGRAKGPLERRLVDAGVNALAFPEEETVRHAEARGLRHRFVERCCSLVEPVIRGA